MKGKKAESRERKIVWASLLSKLSQFRLTTTPSFLSKSFLALWSFLFLMILRLKLAAFYISTKTWRHSDLEASLRWIGLCPSWIENNLAWRYFLWSVYLKQSLHSLLCSPKKENFTFCEFDSWTTHLKTFQADEHNSTTFTNCPWIQVSKIISNDPFINICHTFSVQIFAKEFAED